ncbi:MULTISPECIES: hypothetical protein [unclassified Bradyrhizobium]|uniref:hypothetical protein n=1 Tax=unclassified Bradyrhizobium TaxID=2631580 RepID=UPI001FFBD811|nr:MULTISPECIES: hypothetical protein [unclassified Bradyrhizobium]MCK1611047.1 hypothetical protein [Bradyrhizobium sp. 163]MCK1762801.1 hypothetical protein [Bradyrhizobium sp. 136]
MLTFENLNPWFGVKAARKGIDPSGCRWEETILRAGEDVFTLQVRSDNPRDCFDVEMSLEELFDYTDSADQPFVWAVLSGDVSEPRGKRDGLAQTPHGKLYLVEEPARPDEREAVKSLSLTGVSKALRPHL